MRRNDNKIMHIIEDTKKTYGLLWERSGKDVPARWHFNAMQEVIEEPIVRGHMGIEVGSGCGYDTYIMAKANPSITLVSMDISDGIYNTKQIASSLGNVRPIQCSALYIPLKNDIFDFAYSFGVLHHTPSPQKGLSEMARILKKDSPAFLYLYENHSENIIKFVALKFVACVRAVTVHIPQRVLYALSWIISPFVFIMFTVPAKILRRFNATRHIAGAMPFNFGTGPFSLRGDLYDRFRAPIEYRFSRKGVHNMFRECGFRDIHITRLRDTAGWVVWGYKNAD